MSRSTQDDDLTVLYNEFVEIENEIEKSGRGIKHLALDEATAISEYEELKNKELIGMYAEEVDKGIKRTEKQREALYRIKYADHRRAKLLASANLKSERDLLAALQAKLSSMQSRRLMLMFDPSHTNGI